MCRKRLLLLVLPFFLANFVFAQNSNYDLYLLVGQSNMAGRGKVEAQDTIAFPKVFTLSEDNKWVLAKDPIHFDKSAAGVGLGRTFGIEMSKANPDAKIGLIPCAVGGSSIDAWKPGGYHQQTKSYPWDDMEKRLKIALKNGELKGILWHQGESDSNLEKCYEYEEKLKDLIARLRILAQNPDVPFVAGEIGKFKIKENQNRFKPLKPAPALVVVNATKKVVKEDGNAAFVNSKKLNHRGDNTHFNSASYRELGKRYVKAMLELQK